MKRLSQRRGQRGSALIYILVAVALLAALSYAITQSSRGNLSHLTDEKARLLASEIIEYANVVTSATAQLRLRAGSDSLLCYDDDNWGANDYDHAGCSNTQNRIFSLDGGGVTWANAPAEAMDTTATPDNLWHFYADNEVENVGSTCGAASCADLLMVTDELNLDVCIKLNELLGVDNPSGAPPVDSAIGTTRFIGAYGYAETIGDESGGEALIGKKAACFQKTDNPAKYTFYKVLISR